MIDVEKRSAGDLPIHERANARTRDGTTQVPACRLRVISLLDLGASATKCRYLLEMYVYDRSIRHTFDGTFVNDFTGGNWSYTFMTSSAAP